MGTALQITLYVLKNYKTYAALAAAVSSGVGMILAKNYGGGIETILQALTVVLAGAGAAGVHAAAVAAARVKDA